MSVENQIDVLLGAVGVAGFIAIVIIATLLSLLVYIYTSIALMVTAKKTRTPKPWLAWIPIVNLALVAMIARKPWTWVFLWLINFVPFIGQILFLVGNIYLWWKVCERRKMHGAVSLLQIIGTLGYIVLVSLTAWRNPNKDKQ